MTARQRVIAIRLSDRLNRNPDCAKRIGVEVEIINTERSKIDELQKRRNTV